MTQCEECGARNAEHATFCVRCGAELRHVDERPVGEDTDALGPVNEDAPAADETPAVAPQDAGATEEWQSPEEAVGAVLEGVAEGGLAEELVREAGERLSEGDPDAAAAKCREAIEIAPDLVAAYSLLGMAEEQRGNGVAAAGAYRRVLQLDPDRKVEREKLEMLYAQGLAARHGEVDGAEGGENRVLAWAPWVAAVAAAFFVMMTLTAIGLRVHAANQAEEIYADQMAVAKAALDSGDYSRASRAFESALAVRPEDPDAQRGLRYARRKLASAGDGTSTQRAISQPMPYTASIVPSHGPNPFLPIPIGGSGARDEPEPAQGQPPQTRQTRSTPPPVMSSDESVEVRSTQQTTQPGEEIMPFREVLDEPDEEPEESAEATEDVEAPGEQEESQGEITIWLSPRSGSESGGGAERPSQQSTGSEHADRAYSLRRQAQAAINRGDCEQGRRLLDQAIEQYRADTEQNPARRQANDAAIATCRTLRQQCATGGDQ